MSTSDSADSKIDADPPAKGGSSESSLGPMDGGQWRPVTPDELLRKQPESKDTGAHDERPKVQLQRRQELEQHLKGSPTDQDAYLELAAIYRSESRPLEAKRLLIQANKLFPNDERITWEMEEAVLASSLQTYREVSELATKLSSPDVHRELERSESDWACRRIDVCRSRLERDPSLVHLRVTLAEAMYDAGLFDEAIEQAGEVLDNDELSPMAHLLRGRCLLATGKDLQAMSELRAATMRRSVPSSARVRVVGGRLLVELASRLGLELTLKQYRAKLAQAESDLAAELASSQAKN